MRPLSSVNDCVIRFANVNGTGSASANTLFAKSIFRMGIPVSPKNIFPSNIQGLPTWYEVRISDKGYLGRRGGVDIIVAMNPQSLKKDIEEVRPGGYVIYDNSKKLYEEYLREDLTFIGLPLTELCLREYTDARQRQLFKNIMYVGALAAFMNIDLTVIKQLIHEQFGRKPKLIEPNINALMIGFTYASQHFDDPMGLKVDRRNLTADSIIVNGNAACALGAVYGGCTFVAWYPITPSTSVAESFMKYATKYRKDEHGKNKFAVVQAEDELAAMGMVIGASWNGARAFTATSGPGVSLMSEFIGLAYFAEIPAVLINVQRAGPSTGMPTRTQQGDVMMCAYASHGDTKHPMLIPDSPAECFELTANALELAEQLQTPVMVLTDLDLGMNDHMSKPFQWNENKKYDRGKVLDAEALEQLEDYGRYKDVDGDGISYRTLPGTHPHKGAFFTRGTSKNEFAKYTEDGADYVRNMDRLLKKWETTKGMVPGPVIKHSDFQTSTGMIFYGTTSHSAVEAQDLLAQDGIYVNTLRLRAFPFNEEVSAFIHQHVQVYVVEQNRDGQMRSLLINECEFDPKKLIPVLNYDGSPITAQFIRNKIEAHWNEVSAGKKASQTVNVKV